MSSESPAAPVEVSSLAEYMAWKKAKMPTPNGEGYALLYRGHPDATYLLEPTAYRIKDGKSFRAVEHQLYEELMRLDPVAFSNDKSVFERLVRMLRIPPKLDTCSAANWTVVPSQTGHLFQAKLDTLDATARG